MNLEAFVHERSTSWDTLERLLEQAHGRPERLGAERVLELGRLYRASAADLAFARRRFPGDPLLDRLEVLVLRARHLVYGERRRAGSPVAFFGREYWRLVRGRPRPLALALLATFVPALAAGAWAAHDPGGALGLVPSAFRGAADPHVRHLPTGLTTQAGLAGSIFTNNIRVTFLAFAGGLTFGAVTLVVLMYNGLLLGALGGLTLQAGTFSVFLRYVAPHGVLEVSCIAVAGAAGLRLGGALVDPGLQPRGQALRREARDAVLLVLGTAPWLVVAGLIEGFVTPRGLGLGLALGVGVAAGGLYWTLVLTRGGVTGTPARAVAPNRRSTTEPVPSP